MPASVVAPPMATSPMLAATKSVAAASNGRDIVVAVDAGHGGQDPGAIGRGGTYEKHVTLAIARKLAQAIDREDGMRAVLIRDGDTFVSLRNRIRKAREHGADMFVSIHADSVRDRSVGGSSVYVLSTRGASDEAARWLAERENAADLVGGVSLDDKNDVLASVLLDVTQKEV
jgi:N-acetylmuramoyl-L-alanine amidase